MLELIKTIKFGYKSKIQTIWINTCLIDITVRVQNKKEYFLIKKINIKSTKIRNFKITGLYLTKIQN